ncbi:MAG: hypothetical protein Q9193_001605 [Seirophora villosa]
MTRISIGTNTFRDAICITRELGERYLWIDSLCIVQDNEDDWKQEAAFMADIYGQSYCTLAALSSADSTAGCNLVPNVQDQNVQDQNIQDQNIQGYRKFFEFDSGPYRIRIFEHEPRAWHEEYGDNPYRHGDYDITGKPPLRARAWTLQERELSTKNIHFGKHQLLWECRELKASAQLPWHHKTPEDDFEQPPLRDVATESVAPGRSAAMRDRWYGLVEDYTSRSLTKITDQMIALAR